MKYQFKVTKEKFEEWKKLAKSNWWKFYMDWTFEISWVEWKIHFTDNILKINITDKPWLASWSMIEDKLNEFFK